MLKQAIGCFMILMLCGCYDEEYLKEHPQTSTAASEKNVFTFVAQYSMSFEKVERPKSFNDRYSQLKTDTVVANQKYNFFFEDSIFQIFWLVNRSVIGFYMNNKTEHSLKIIWDEAAFVDQNGSTHRVMHQGIKYSNKDQSQPPSIVVRKGNYDDIIQPTDYVYWKEGTENSSGSWENKPIIDYFDLHYNSQFIHENGKYPTLEAFTTAVNANVGKSIQVLLPIRIEETTNDYIFTFKIDSVSTKTDTKE
jgi:hypothetical protein